MNGNEQSTLRKYYNIISDIITGINFRKSDNLFQFWIVLISVIAIVIAGQIWGIYYSSSLWPDTKIGNLLASISVGMILGGFISGAYLAFFRFIQHIKGVH